MLPNCDAGRLFFDESSIIYFSNMSGVSFDHLIFCIFFLVNLLYPKVFYTELFCIIYLKILVSKFFWLSTFIYLFIYLFIYFLLSVIHGSLFSVYGACDLGDIDINLWITWRTKVMMLSSSGDLLLFPLKASFATDWDYFIILLSPFQEAQVQFACFVANSMLVT